MPLLPFNSKRGFAQMAATFSCVGQSQIRSSILRCSSAVISSAILLQVFIHFLSWRYFHFRSSLSRGSPYVECRSSSFLMAPATGTTLRNLFMAKIDARRNMVFAHRKVTASSWTRRIRSRSGRMLKRVLAATCRCGGFQDVIGV